jgi:hypothetical protein
MLHKDSFKKLTTVFLVVSVITVLSITTKAQDVKNANFHLSKNAIANLNNGIKSENLGLRKNSIYFSGVYLVTETGETLVEQLQKEEDPNLRILITKTLYLIGNDKFMNVINDVAENDKDLKVREFASSIYSMMQLEKSMKVAGITK